MVISKNNFQKEALYYKRLKGDTLQCVLCPWNCVIKNKKRGFCRSRENVDGKLFSLSYSKPCSVSLDPIEKKPLFHFLPGSKTYSVGTSGCNLRCKFCQNWTIAQRSPEEVKSKLMMPEEVILNAIKSNASSIAYTYNEPTVFFEYALEISKLAKKKGLKNVMVTNGYINTNPLHELYEHIDAVNVDLKGFSSEFYNSVCGVLFEPVLEALKEIKKTKTFIEITNLLIPTLNDDFKFVTKMCEWIVNNLGCDTPLHFSRFFPDFELDYIPKTSLDVMHKAREVALKSGLRYVYLGNMPVTNENNTVCPKCSKIVVSRDSFLNSEVRLKEGFCECGERIPGVWK